MNNIQWASGDIQKLESNKQDLVKLKPFTDLTGAMSEAIKESTAANNRITQQIVKNIDTGQAQREKNIKFFTEFAPEATGKVYEGIQHLKEFRAHAKKVTNNQEALQNQNAAVVQGHKLLNNRENTISGLFYAENDFKLANKALEGRNVRGLRTKMINNYWEKIRPGVEEAMASQEFVMDDGKSYTLATAPSHYKLEIRNRIDVTIAAHAHATGAFTMKEVVNGILFKSQKKNTALYISDVAAEAEQNQKEYFVNKNKNLITDIKANDPTATWQSIDNSRNAIKDAQAVQGENYKGLSITESSLGIVKTVLKMVALGEDNGGITPAQGRAQLTHNIVDPKDGGPGIYWGNKRYSNLVEAFNDQHAGEGNKWLKAIDDKISENLDTKKKVFNDAITSQEMQIFENLKGATNDAEYTQILTEGLEAFNGIDGFDTNGYSHLSPAMRNMMFHKEDNLFSAWQTKKLITSLYAQKRPVDPALVKSLPEFMRADIEEAYKGRVWSWDDTAAIKKRMETKGILSPRVLTVAFPGTTRNELADLTKNLEDEINYKIMKNYDQLILSNDHNTSIAQATEAVIKEFEADIDAAMKQGKGQKEAQKTLRDKLEELAKPGILEKNEYRSPNVINRLVHERHNFLNNVVAKNNEFNNISLLKSEEFLKGEQDHMDELLEWVNTGGLTKLPNFYGAFSRKSGIPIDKVALMRAESLGHILGEKDQDLFKEKIKNLSDRVNQTSNATKALMTARTVGQQNLIRLNKDISEDDTFISEQFHPSAATFAKNNEGSTAYDSMENVDQADYKHDTPISGMSLYELQNLFGKGDYYNIGAFGITNEKEFNLILNDLNKAGLIKPEDKFNKDTQLLFYKQAIIRQNRKLQMTSGIVKEPTILTEEELKECGLGNQAYPLNKDICDIIHGSYIKKNKK